MSEKKIADLSFEELSEQAADFRKRINTFRTSLSRFFVAKQDLIDLMTLCAVIQEPLLFVGPPGTAKSALVLKFTDALGLDEGDYFEYMLTRFTEPAEVFGPIDIKLLREGQYTRRIAGKLPTARLVFLDEIFKSNSAILNALLTVINERKFYQDGKALPVAMKVLFAATNDIPEQAELAALKDRFTLKAACRGVQERHFLPLIDAGLADQTARDLNKKPWAEGHAKLGDFLKAHLYLARTFARVKDGQTDRQRFFREELLLEMRRIIKTLVKEDGVFVSDRKVIKLYRLLRANAWLHRGGVVEREDLKLLKYLGESSDEIDLLEEKVPTLIGLE
jgi:MoxR-like ATPase